MAPSVESSISESKRAAARKAAQKMAQQMAHERDVALARVARDADQEVKDAVEASASLWQRMRTASDTVGFDMHTGDQLMSTTVIPVETLSTTATKLRRIIFDARRAQLGPVEQAAAKVYYAALRKKAALERSRELERKWLALLIADVAAEQQGGRKDAAQRLQMQAAADRAVAAAVKMERVQDSVSCTTDDVAGAEGAPGSSWASVRSRRFASELAMGAARPMTSGGTMPAAITTNKDRAAALAAKILASRPRKADLATSRNESRSSMLGSAYWRALDELPARIPVPQATVDGMCSSLAPVLAALSRGLDEKSAEYAAAASAFTSWHKTEWFDARTNETKSKSPKGWTIEQYALDGFAALYAKRLHVARVACARQCLLWLLENAPGLPVHTPLVIADLGAGSCAACVGARYALRDYGGEDQPFRVFPIDVSSSSERFREAFEAMTRPVYGGSARAVLLPQQKPDQYLTEEQPGVDKLLASLLRQLRACGSRQPHIIVASFSLHYLKPEERASFFASLHALVERPLLLVIIKGVGETQRPMNWAVRSVFFGVHYYIGNTPVGKPRVAEAHACLVVPKPKSISDAPPTASAASVDLPPPTALPSPPSIGMGNELITGTGGIQYDREDPDSWVLSTFAALERRCRRYGLYAGLTELTEEKLRPA